MRVYQLQFSINLPCKPQDADLLAGEFFSGCPYPNKWQPVELTFERGKPTKADFYGVGAGAFVCSEKVSLWSGPLWDEGEFLPVKVKGLKGKYSLFNVTRCASHLNSRKTVWETTKAGEQRIKSPAFHAARLGEDCVFKIPEDGAKAIYALERDDVPGHESLRALVKQHGLTGLKFKLVWTDTPKNPKRPKALKSR